MLQVCKNRNGVSSSKTCKAFTTKSAYIEQQQKLEPAKFNEESLKFYGIMEFYQIDVADYREELTLF